MMPLLPLKKMDGGTLVIYILRKWLLVFPPPSSLVLIQMQPYQLEMSVKLSFLPTLLGRHMVQTHVILNLAIILFSK